MRRNQHLEILFLFFVIFHFSACASVYKPSPFLGGTELAEGKYFKREWVAADADFSRYRKVKVELVELGQLEKGKSMKQTDVEALASEFRTELEQQLWDNYQVLGLTEEPDAETLVIRPALVYLRSSKPLLNLITMVVIFIPVSSGSAAFEAQLVDGGSGKVVARFSEKRTAGVVSVKSLLLDSFTKYGHAKTAFKKWGEQLVVFLGERSSR